MSRFYTVSEGDKLLHIVDQNYIAIYRAARQEQLLAVSGPGEVEDLAFSKVCDLLWRVAIEGLAHQVGNAIAVIHVQHGFAVGRPSKGRVNQVGDFGWLAALNGHIGDLKPVYCFV